VGLFLKSAREGWRDVRTPFTQRPGKFFKKELYACGDFKKQAYVGSQRQKGVARLRRSTL
jgi:hypothetical protein